jgi:hypothetical protein
MLRVSDPHHFRKTLAGACMMLAPIVLLAGMVIHPERKTDEAAQLAVVADNLDAWFIAHLLVAVSLLLVVPAVLGLMHMLREREVALAHVGGGLALAGILAVTGLVAIDGFVGWQMGAAGADRAEMTALLERVNETAGVFIPFYLMSFAFALGIVVLAFGLYRARAVQWWMAAFLAIAAVLLAIAGPTASDVLSIVGAAFLVVGLGSIGRLVLTESDEDWEHTPEYKGFKPLAGMR